MRGESGEGEVIVDPVIEAPVAEPSDTTVPAIGQDVDAIAAPETGDRDEKGRFKPKAEPTPVAAEGAEAPVAPETKTTETEAPADAGAQTEPTRIPPSLSAAVKAQWATIPPEVQKDISRLEDSVQTAKAEWGKKGERLNRFDEILAPHVDRWRIAGLDEVSGIQTLLAAQASLDRNPLDGLVHIARSYGVTPAQLAQAYGLQMSGQQPGMEGQPTPTMAPDVAAVLQQHLSPLQQQVQTLQQQLSDGAKQSEAERLADAQRQVQDFANDPANLYFENVRQDVGQLIESGAAKSLQEAYQKAIWMNDDIRPLLLKAQTEEAAKTAATAQADAARKAQEQARSKASSARQAGGSVTGAPAPGAQAPAAPNGNLRETLAAAMREHATQV